MPKGKVVHNVFISCTSDIFDEVEIVKKEINNLNVRFKKLPVRLEYLYWKEDLDAEYGYRAQESINRQLVNDADIGIVIIDKRLGSNTGKFDSGVVEEINVMKSKGKKIYVYFSEKKSDENNSYDSEFIKEKNRVENFKKEFGKEAIYRIYEDLKDFRLKLNKDLETYILDINIIYTPTIRHKDELPISHIIITIVIFISVLLNFILISKSNNVEIKREIVNTPLTPPPTFYIPNTNIKNQRDFLKEYQNSLKKIKQWQFWYNVQVGSNYYYNDDTNKLENQ